MWHDGKPHGRGAYISAGLGSGDGNWEQGLKQGFGTFTSTAGHRYEMEWVNNCMIKGRFTSVDGSVYEGEVQNGKAHGQGIQTKFDGQVYEGEFKNNVWDGIGELREADGTIKHGEFKEGYMVSEFWFEG